MVSNRSQGRWSHAPNSKALAPELGSRDLNRAFSQRAVDPFTGSGESFQAAESPGSSGLPTLPPLQQAQRRGTPHLHKQTPRDTAYPHKPTINTTTLSRRHSRQVCRNKEGTSNPASEATRFGPCPSLGLNFFTCKMAEVQRAGKGADLQRLFLPLAWKAGLPGTGTRPSYRSGHRPS